MFELIIQKAQQSDYDFRKTANPSDPLAHLFDEWVDYYKLKWAIANVLEPSSILEIGVRFGYSAQAFLHGNPSAKYTGIDLDSDSYGGVRGAINWAKAATQSFATDFIIVDTQTLEYFPGDIYDLIHVDGQQDGDGSFHDLELALKQGRYILVDGYFWTRQNYTAISDFLFRHAKLLDFYGVIPGYAGELLIKVSPTYLEQVSKEQSYKTNSNFAICQAYIADYYAKDYSGFETYRRNKGKRLQDPRLQAIATISSLKAKGSALDIGCGSGELTYYFARQGFKTTAIDNSADAIQLAVKCFDEAEHLLADVQFLCDNACTVPLQVQYDLAVASDVIEHLSPDEVDTLYQKVAKHLKPDGLFVLHTFPNLWYYKYEYPRRRKIAASVGAYLPPEPNTSYGLWMHINEQSPRVLKQQLSKHFKHVLLWFGDINNPGGSLLKKFSIKEMRAAHSLFAIASHQPIDLDQLKSRLQMAPLPVIQPYEIKIAVKDFPKNALVKSEFIATVEITNKSRSVLNSCAPNPVHLSYHWLDSKATKNVIFEGERTKLIPPLNNKESQKIFDLLSAPTNKQVYDLKVSAPSEAGNYVLRITLVQEGVRWFDQEPIGLAEDISISIHNN
ncbi:methyltransferase domain-containing protein [Leptolyngbya sp. FACHB-671]|uniref:methyltransferase domain-containing protein n=1 Tax=Leptolyngbya sp. FACHB-671 TaxID=2692812 RepID=UPI001687D290|nr:methyltransferase domain-containing protein [Leptolyngbya sp. FACHB-671]MBD1869711.1 methyltransferase domain-containing protein [Cyanobacteria bacterium FACHB-471]MBD2068582.1 methyltransferase domain-containing protein [Leptolyngbya sp. FACHB-671]